MPNGGQYSNRRFDALVSEAASTLDPAKRGALLNQAIEMAMADVALIPLFFPVSTWACRSDLTFVPAVSEYTRAMYVRPA